MDSVNNDNLELPFKLLTQRVENKVSSSWKDLFPKDARCFPRVNFWTTLIYYF